MYILRNRIQKLMAKALCCFALLAPVNGLDAAEYPGAPPASVGGMTLSNYLGSHTYWSQLKSFVIQYESALGPCRTPLLNKRQRAAPAKHPVNVPNFGIPPQWIEVLDIEGCEQTFTREIATMMIDGKPRFMPFLRGNSMADPFLQIDVLRTLMPLARSEASKAQCHHANDVRIIEAKLINRRRGNEHLIWSEEWHVENCHGVHAYNVKFNQKAGQGTTFSITRS